MTIDNTEEKISKPFICDYDNPVVETTSGKLRGYIWNGIYTFLGIKYADAKRFQMPDKVRSWDGIKNAYSYGAVCPVLNSERYENEILVPHRCWTTDENCQFLNIWSPDIDKSARRPVMVWLHGGGFSGGSSIEQITYDGENLSRYGDVIVITLNHRLNILGYLDLSFLGDKYKNSANAGSEDIIAALRWIHENIKNFGGDPENITLFGQSGGGMKVWTLMQTPSAEGLFHKGIVQSGVLDNISIGIEKDSQVLGYALLKELGITASQSDRLDEIPYEQLAKAYNKVLPHIQEIKGYAGNEPKPGKNYLGDPRNVGFCQWAKTIPVMIGSVFGEFNCNENTICQKPINDTQTFAKLKIKHGEHTDKLISLFKEAYPDKNLQDLLFLDSQFRLPVITFIKERTKSKESNTYSYLFTYNFPLFGKTPAWHCSELPFVFHNIAKIPVCSHSPETENLEKEVSNAWISFAKYGRPQISNTEWPACTAKTEFTMILDKHCKVKENFDHELIHIHSKCSESFRI